MFSPVVREMIFHDVNLFGLICDIITVQRGRLPDQKMSRRPQDGQPNLFPILRIIHPTESSQAHEQ
jgi:hypothetical protein